MPIAPGTKIGDYEIQAPLGSGGMGAVYQAHDPTLQRTVAIKVLAKQDEDASARLLQEARAASALNHPHICTIYEVGEHEGQAFIVMEHVEGKPLSQLIPSDGLPPESVIRYGTQIADALAHAHERGIVHRDLKSQNVVITPEGRAKVLDFGLAARMPQADAEAVTKTQDAIPHAGMLVGTLAYMAPEVLRGEAATARSDIWALGVLLYEMASGRLPFGGKTGADVASATLKESPAALPSQISAGLRAIVNHTLAKEPNQRYGTASEARVALETIQSDTGTQQVSITPVGATRTWRVAAAVIGLVLVASVIGYWLRPGSQSTAAPPSTVPRLTSPTQVTSAAGQETSPSWSPDGGRVAFEAIYDDDWDIFVTQIAGGQPVNITADHQGLDRFPSWSPDGRTIAFVSQRDGAWGLYVTAAVGGSPRRLSALRSSTRGAPQWSPDGEEIAVHGYESGENFVETVSVESQETRRVRLPDHEGYESSNLRWSPDGRYFAYLDKLGGYEITRLWLVPASGGEPSPVTDGTTNDWSPSWSADGRTLFFVSNRGGSMDLWQQGIDEHGAVSGEAKPLTTGLGIDAAVFSPGGTTLAYSRGSRFSSTNVWRIPILEDRLATWTDAEQLTFDDGAYLQFVDVAQDGTRLVMSSDRRGNQDLWMVPSTGGSLTPLTTDRTPDWDPEWSPDGQAIAFYAVPKWKSRGLGHAHRMEWPGQAAHPRRRREPDVDARCPVNCLRVSTEAGVANIWIHSSQRR